MNKTTQVIHKEVRWDGTWAWVLAAPGDRIVFRVEADDSAVTLVVRFAPEPKVEVLECPVEVCPHYGEALLSTYGRCGLAALFDELCGLL